MGKAMEQLGWRMVQRWVSEEPGGFQRESVVLISQHPQRMPWADWVILWSLRRPGTRKAVISYARISSSYWETGTEDQLVFPKEDLNFHWSLTKRGLGFIDQLGVVPKCVSGKWIGDSWPAGSSPRSPPFPWVGHNALSSVQLLSRVRLLATHGLQHAGLPCPSPTPRACSNHVRWVRDAIQPSHPLSSPSPPALNLSQHQGLFQWVSFSHQVAKVLEFQLQC